MTLVTDVFSRVSITNNPTKSVLHSSVQGPALLSDPNDVTTSFIRSIDPKTGSTSKIEANAAIDEYSFAKNRNAFQRGAAAATGGGHDNNGEDNINEIDNIIYLPWYKKIIDGYYRYLDNHQNIYCCKRI